MLTLGAMVRLHTYLLVLLAHGLGCVQASATSESVGGQVNPVRKVVTMLQNIQKKVEAEGEKAKSLHDKFVCYCKNNAGLLQASLDSSRSKLPQLEAEIEAAKEEYAQLQDTVATHKRDAASGVKAIKRATMVRKKESAAYKDYVKEQGINMESVNKAVAALIKGMGSSFLQSPSAARVQKAASTLDMDEEGREQLLAFLSSSRSTDASPAGGAIIGILKEMAHTLEVAIGQATRVENRAIKSYDGLMQAKAKEVSVAKQAIREQSKRMGDLKLMTVQKQEELAGAQKALVQDKKFATEMQKRCSTASDDYEKEAQTRQQELQAIADTIKILSNDDARDLLKKTLPSSASSFLQLETTMAKMRERALELLRTARSARGGNSQLDLILLALHGKKVGFSAITSKIDALLEELQKEEDADVKKKVYCLAKLDTAADTSKVLEHQISDTKSSIASEKEGLAAVMDDLAALDKHIKELDKDVAEATEQRKEEHAAFLDMAAENSAAQELLRFAQERLRKFYGAAFAQSSLEESIPPAAPEMDSYKKKTADSNNVIIMIEVLIGDLEKDMAAAKTEEKDAQEDYEAMLRDSKEKRDTDSKTFMAQERTRADLKSSFQDDISENKATTKELMSHEEKIASIHKACDWLLQNFDARRAARSSEMENLKNAKLVLSSVEV